jgi:SAM-dependent methyltransferase
MTVKCPSDQNIDEVHDSIKSYYTEKLSRHGATPLGVDWSCVPTQYLRFVQLLKLCDFSRPFSLNDIGCGYGALLSYLAEYRADAEIDYFGVDLSPAMIRRAKRLWRGRHDAKFMVGHGSPRIADYSIASGIFNVRLDQSIARWEGFVAETLADMHDGSRRGFAVNFISPQAPAEATQSGLYRAPAEQWIAHCRAKFDASVELIEAYGLREYTLLVRK